MSDKGGIRGWCGFCGSQSFASQKDSAKGKLACRVCGGPLKPVNELSDDERAMLEMQVWFAKVCKDGLNGPSQMGAAEELDCSRSMIDRLVERGVLEKSEFNFKDRNVVIISKRSIEKAKENRRQTGNWTGHPVSRGS